MNSDNRRYQVAVGALLLIVTVVVIVLIATRDSSGNNAVTATSTTQQESTTTEASTTTAGNSTTSTEATTTTTTVIDPEETETDEVSGNLLVTEFAAWEPTFNVGDLVQNSNLCSFFSSETKAYTWLTAIRLAAEETDGDFLEILNERYDVLRKDYWNQLPAAAASMMHFLEIEKPWLPTLVMNVYLDVDDNAWDYDDPSKTMGYVEELTWTALVAQPASFRTTGCDNWGDPADEWFRDPFYGHNVVVSPDDSDWVPTLVDVILPSHVNTILAEIRGNFRIYQTIDEDGMMSYDIGDGNGMGGVIEISRKVSVSLIISLEGQHVIVEGLFSTVCGNVMLPEFAPPRKETPPTTTTTTVPSTTTTTTVPVTTTTTTTMTTTTTTTTTIPKGCEPGDPNCGEDPPACDPLSRPPWDPCPVE